MPDMTVKHRLCVANHCSPPLYRHLQYGGGNFEHLIIHLLHIVIVYQINLNEYRYLITIVSVLCHSDPK